MNQSERRLFLIQSLLQEQPGYRDVAVPRDTEEQKRLLRSLMNVREAAPVSADFLAVQDEYLRAAIAEKGVTDLADLTPVRGELYLWQGDITTLRCDAIVNAANAGMTGCYRPCHNCIDNCIHTYAGVQLRSDCAALMARQGHGEPTGRAKITPAYNLPCRWVIHTVGPIVEGVLTKRHREQLSSCYKSCLQIAGENGIASIAFCCISTGVFGFPKREAAEIAVATVESWKRETASPMQVIFNVFGNEDLAIYQNILTQ